MWGVFRHRRQSDCEFKSHSKQEWISAFSLWFFYRVGCILRRVDLPGSEQPFQWLKTSRSLINLTGKWEQSANSEFCRCHSIWSIYALHHCSLCSLAVCSRASEGIFSHAPSVVFLNTSKNYVCPQILRNKNYGRWLTGICKFCCSHGEHIKDNLVLVRDVVESDSSARLNASSCLVNAYFISRDYCQRNFLIGTKIFEYKINNHTSY